MTLVIIFTLWGILTGGASLDVLEESSYSYDFTYIAYIKIVIPMQKVNIQVKNSGKIEIQSNPIPAQVKPILVLNAILFTLFVSAHFSKSYPCFFFQFLIFPIYSVGEIWWYTSPAEELVSVQFAVSYSCKRLSIILWSSSFSFMLHLQINGLILGISIIES